MAEATVHKNDREATRDLPKGCSAKGALQRVDHMLFSYSYTPPFFQFSAENFDVLYMEFSGHVTPLTSLVGMLELPWNLFM